MVLLFDGLQRVRLTILGLTNEGADVLADALFDFDVESTVGGDVEVLPCGVVGCFVGTFHLDGATSGYDLHSLGLFSAKVELAGINESECFFAAVL